MAPFLMTALVGIGVKIATDLFMSGVKQIMKPTGAATSADAIPARRAVGATTSR